VADTAAKRIKKYLNDNGIKQSFLAKKTGIKPQTLNSKLNESIRLNADDIELICTATGQEPNAFLKSRKGD
jgi:transcriptional regulator with XRE-family HTH domain